MVHSLLCPTLTRALDHHMALRQQDAQASGTSFMDSPSPLSVVVCDSSMTCECPLCVAERDQRRLVGVRPSVQPWTPRIAASPA